MPDEKRYTISEIERAFEYYDKTKVLRVLKDGKWHTQILDGSPVGTLDATKAQVKDLDSVMSFPEFLRDIWTKIVQ